MMVKKEKQKIKITKWSKVDWKKFFIGFITGCISSGLGAFVIFVVKYVTNRAMTQSVDGSIFAILFIFLISLLSILFAFISKIFLAKLSAKKIAQIRSDVFENIQNLSPSDLSKYSSNSLMTRLSLDVYNFSMYYNWLLINVVPSFIRWLIFSIMIAIISWIICLLMILLSFVLLGVSILFSKNSHRYYEKSISSIDNVNKIVEENILGARVIRSFNLFDRQIKRFERVNKEILENSRKAETKTFLSFPFAMAFVNGGAILVILFSVFVNWPGVNFLGTKIAIGDILAIFSYAYLVLWSVYDSTFLYVFYTRSLVSINRIKEILALKSKNINYDGLDFEHGTIEFQNVSFKYFDESNDYVLKNLSFKIKKNSSLGIIGQTGSGKTTLLNLITRMWDVTEGKILINGIDIKEIKTSSLLDHLSFAFQDKKLLFSGSIAQNLKIANESITLEQMEKAVEIAQLDDFIKSNKDGLNYQLEEFGQNLSGGQKQRVNIARAISKKANIYLFDDVTSALDNLTEAKLLSVLKENFQDATIIMSSQKISSIQNMDQIIVLDKGEISNIGTHEELLIKDNVYRQIYQLQNRKEE